MAEKVEMYTVKKRDIKMPVLAAIIVIAIVIFYGVYSTFFSPENWYHDEPGIEIIAGDEIILDFAGKIDGKEFEGGSAEKYRMKVGEGRFIPGFEDAIIGHCTGETFDIDITFPDEYTPELAGKDAVFTIYIHGVYRK